MARRQSPPSPRSRRLRSPAGRGQPQHRPSTAPAAGGLVGRERCDGAAAVAPAAAVRGRRRLPVLRAAAHGQRGRRAAPPGATPGRANGPAPGHRERRAGRGARGGGAGDHLTSRFSPQWAPRLCGAGLRLFVHVANTVSADQQTGQ